MKKIVLALSAVMALTCASYAQEAVFQSMDSVDEIQKVELQPVGDVAPAAKTTVVTGSIQEEKFKSAITNLDDASAEIREQLINYNSLLTAAEAREDQIKSEIKGLKKNVSQTKKKLKNIEKSKKYINSNFEQDSTKS